MLIIFCSQPENCIQQPCSKPSEECVASSQKERLQTLQERVQARNNHQAEANHQRSALKAQIAGLTKGKVVIIGDFKANENLPITFRQVRRDYYQKSSRSYLGFTVYYSNSLTTNPDAVIKQHFDFVSDTLTKNAYYLTTALNKLFESSIFKGMKNLDFWYDNGGGQVLKFM